MTPRFQSQRWVAAVPSLILTPKIRQRPEKFPSQDDIRFHDPKLAVAPAKTRWSPHYISVAEREIACAPENRESCATDARGVLTEWSTSHCKQSRIVHVR